MRLFAFLGLAVLGLVAAIDVGEGPRIATRARARAAVQSPAPRVQAPKPAPPPMAAPLLAALPVVERWLPERRGCRRTPRRRRCNGPRRVPEPMGKEAQVAEGLGLGTHRAAAVLIRGNPPKSWIVAARRMGLSEPELPLAWPVADGRFGRGYGRGRAAGGPRHHRGVDVTAEVGTPVRAVADGLVAYADNTVSGYGNLLVLLHGGGEVSMYAHLSAVHVFPGQIVRRGQPLAEAGNTGISRGPHLHLEWREDGLPRDPMGRFPRARWPEWMRRSRPEPAR